MMAENYFKFLGNRIKNLQTALFFDLSTSILKFPVSIITISEIDTSGNILFNVNKPYLDMGGVNKDFFSQLQFYTKESDYHINIQGMATIVAKETNGPFDSGPLACNNEVLISVKIITAEYCCSRRKKRPAIKYYMGRMKDWWWNNGLHQTTVKMPSLLVR